MASGGNEPVSDGGGGKHSIFASVFIDALKSANQRFFTAEDLFFNYIKEPVVGRASQTPEYSTIRNSGHDGGDFIFYNWKNFKKEQASNNQENDSKADQSFSISEQTEEENFFFEPKDTQTKWNSEYN